MVVLTVVSVIHALETPDLKSCGLRGFLLRCSASDELELRSTGATKSYVVAATYYSVIIDKLSNYTMFHDHRS